MDKTSGIIIPSGYSSIEELMKDLKRRDEEAEYTPWGPDMFSHSDDVEEFLEHFGVKGMRWGVRRAQSHKQSGIEKGINRKLRTVNKAVVSKRTDREARKDAQEFARAKMFFGEGAGTRRKLIKAQVEAKSKKDPSYKKAFDKHLSDQDLGGHAQKARSERRRKDVGKKGKQTAGALARRFTGEMGTTAAFVGVALAGAAFLSSPKGRSLMKKGVSSLENMQESVVRRVGARDVANLINEANFRFDR